MKIAYADLGVMVEDQQHVLLHGPLLDAAARIDGAHGIQVVGRDPGEALDVDGEGRQVGKVECLLIAGLDQHALMAGIMSGGKDAADVRGYLGIPLDQLQTIGLLHRQEILRQVEELL